MSGAVSKQVSNPLDARGCVLAALALSAIGALFYNMMPLYLGLAQDFKQLDHRATGFIGGAFFLGYNIATISSFFWIRRVDWRLVFWIATPIAAVALYAGAMLSGYWSYLAVTVLAGAAFASIYGVGTTAIGDTSHPSRWYGVKIALEAATGAVLFLREMDDRDSKLVYFTGIDKARFRRAVRPGDQLRISVDVVKLRARSCKMRGRAEVDGELAAEAELLSALVDRDP